MAPYRIREAVGEVTAYAKRTKQSPETSVLALWPRVGTMLPLNDRDVLAMEGFVARVRRATETRRRT